MKIYKSIADLPWPKKGDSIFTPSDDRRYNACFHFLQDKINLYADGYLHAAEMVISSIVDSTDRVNNRDDKVYPILLLYHHHIELKLKNIITKGNSLLYKREKFPPHHEIYKLWIIARKIICQINKDNTDKEVVKTVEKVIRELSSISIDAEGYRYPYDKEGNLLLKDVDTLNLGTLRRTMKRITTFLDAVCEQIYVYLDYKRDAEKC